ncbi:MAG: hypothetical protein RJA36_2775 [Pseudomonadota bacterium]|jgi:3-methylfumaryl-CoA hydratase
MDIGHLKSWIGRESLDEDTLALRHARLMAATLGQDSQALAEGAELPPLWHWIYFLEGLPPVQLPNRMWAGDTVDLLAPLRLGEPARKRSRIESIEHKRGRSGELVFVTVLHELEQGGQTAVRERHDIV